MLREESSDQSILAVMTRFVQAVNAMDETVMIPMRLKDLPDEQGKSHPQKVSCNDYWQIWVGRPLLILIIYGGKINHVKYKTLDPSLFSGFILLNA